MPTPAAKSAQSAAVPASTPAPSSDLPVPASAPPVPDASPRAAILKAGDKRKRKVADDEFELADEVSSSSSASTA